MACGMWNAPAKRRKRENVWDCAYGTDLYFNWRAMLRQRPNLRRDPAPFFCAPPKKIGADNRGAGR
jgi:hypothetical protein